MTYQDRLDGVIAEIEEHNKVVGEGNPGYVDPQKFLSCLKAQLSTATEESLNGMRYENVAACLPVDCVPTNLKPKDIPFVKSLARVLRGKNEEETPVGAEKRYVGNRTAARMTVKELVENFDPEDTDSAVTKRLKGMAKKNAFIVFEAGRVVDVKTTLSLLQEIKQNFPSRANITVDGKVKRVYKIGILPDSYADENPLYHGRPLLPLGSTCDQTQRSWEGVSMDIRQLIYIAVLKREIKVTRETANDILDIVHTATNPFLKLKERYRGSALTFDELSDLANLPKLKISLNPSEGGDVSTNPFDRKLTRKKVDWSFDTTSNSYRARN